MKNPVVKLLWMIAAGLGLICIFLFTLRQSIPSFLYAILLGLAFSSALAGICISTIQEKPKHYRWRLAVYGGIFCVLIARIFLEFI